MGYCDMIYAHHICMYVRVYIIFIIPPNEMENYHKDTKLSISKTLSQTNHNNT